MFEPGEVVVDDGFADDNEIRDERRKNDRIVKRMERGS